MQQARLEAHQMRMTTYGWVTERLERDNAPADAIIRSIRTSLDAARRELEYWTAQGFDFAHDIVRELTSQVWNLEDALQGALDRIIDASHASIDSIQSAYSTMRRAAQEFAETGYITIDSFQQLLQLGPEYLSLLRDENGQLHMNEEAIERVKRARLEQATTEAMLAYSKAVLQAATEGDTAALKRLTGAMQQASEYKRGLAFWNIRLAEAIGLTTEKAETARDVLRAMETFEWNVSLGIADSIREEQGAVMDILRFIMDMIRWEARQQIENLREQIRLFQDIVRHQRESLRFAQQRESHERNVERRVRDIAELQRRINLLALDDSREAQAERRRLEEQLFDLQENLTDEQNRYAIQQTERTLDAMLREFQDQKNEEIRIVEDTVSSHERVYRLAIQRITDHWDTLFEDLIHWNYVAGNSLQSELVSAWEVASQAAARYGSLLEAILQTQQRLAGSAGGGSAEMGSQPGVIGNTPPSSAQENERAHTVSGAQHIVNQMLSNASQWHDADAATQNALNRDSVALGNQLSTLIGRPVVRSQQGVWYLDRIGGQRLFDTINSGGIERIFKYHTGGVAGDQPTLRDNEILAKLERGELVFDKPKKEMLYELVDLASVLSEKFGRSVDVDRLSSLLTPTRQLLPSASELHGISDVESSSGGLIFSPEINVTVEHSGRLDAENAKQVGRNIGDGAVERINEAATRLGIRGLSGGAALKPI